MALEWSEDLSVGYGLIDDQHKELFTRYNSLIQACKERQGREAIRSMLDFLVEYVTEHFAEEEQYMQRYNYPGRVEHMQQHSELFQLVNKTYEDLQINGASVDVITSVNHTMLNWLLHHVRKVDTSLGRYLSGLKV